MSNKEVRLVHVLHKCKDRRQGELAVGKVFTFPTGDGYEVQKNGSLVRTTKKLTASDKRKIRREEGSPSPRPSPQGEGEQGGSSEASAL
jgi:hypothetical protein